MKPRYLPLILISTLAGAALAQQSSIALAQSLENRVFAASPPVPTNAAEQDPLPGSWTYRSLLNNPDPAVEFNKLRFGVATITLEKTAMGEIKGTIGGTGWSLEPRLRYSIQRALPGQGQGRRRNLDL